MPVLDFQRVDRVKAIRSLFMLAFASFIAKLAFSHQLGTLLGPPIRVTAECGSVVMIGVALIVLVGMIRDVIKGHKAGVDPGHVNERCEIPRQEHDHSHGHALHHDYGQGHTHAPGKSAKCILFLFGGTLLAAFTWNPAALGTALLGASAGTVNTSSAGSDSSVWKVPEVPEPAISDHVNVQSASLAQVAVQLPGAPTRFIGHPYQLTGFVYHPNGMPRDFFVLMRYFIYCCAADATPVGITVRDPNAWQYLNNSWVTVSGTITTAPIPLVSQLAPTSWYEGHTNQPVLVANKLQLVHTPTEPYMFP